MTRTIGFVGAGNMAEAMLRGLLRGEDFAPGQVSASGPRQERVHELREKYGINATTDNHVPASAEIVVLSVKPQIMSAVLREIELGPVWSGPSVSRGRVYVGTGNTLFIPADYEAFFPKKYTGVLYSFGLPGKDEVGGLGEGREK